jgi:hypothetical protein
VSSGASRPSLGTTRQSDATVHDSAALVGAAGGPSRPDWRQTDWRFALRLRCLPGHPTNARRPTSPGPEVPHRPSLFEEFGSTLRAEHRRGER